MSATIAPIVIPPAAMPAVVAPAVIPSTGMGESRGKRRKGTMVEIRGDRHGYCRPGK
jgi:hypothetical protein